MYIAKKELPNGRGWINISNTSRGSIFIYVGDDDGNVAKVELTFDEYIDLMKMMMEITKDGSWLRTCKG